MLKWKIKLLLQYIRIKLRPSKCTYFTCDDIYPIDLISNRKNRKLIQNCAAR